MSKALRDRKERVLLVGLARTQTDVPKAEQSLAELSALADTAGAEDVGRVIQVRAKPDPATYIGKGKAREVVDQARALEADAIIFDEELAPAQGRNLEDMAGVNPLAQDPMKIIDRTGLILDVFSQHARSLEGKLQVELAQISYMTPRLRGWGDVMSRIGGGTGAGLGTRGPGETKLEVDRRRIQRRLAKLRVELKDVERTRKVKRHKRLKAGVAQISLVGYTNAGKSTLLNTLTDAEVLVEDKLFSTLDPTARRLKLDDKREAVLIDTVGLVRKLPHQLIEAFRSTLEETVLADLLLQVIDVTGSEPESHAEAVNGVLVDIGADDIPRVLALNKADLLDAAGRDRVRKIFPEGVFVAASTGEGMVALLEKISDRLKSSRTVSAFDIPFDRGDIRSSLHAEAEVLEESHDQDCMHLLVRGSPTLITRYREFLAS